LSDLSREEVDIRRNEEDEMAREEEMAEAERGKEEERRRTGEQEDEERRKEGWVALRRRLRRVEGVRSMVPCVEEGVGRRRGGGREGGCSRRKGKTSSPKSHEAPGRQGRLFSFLLLT